MKLLALGRRLASCSDHIVAENVAIAEGAKTALDAASGEMRIIRHRRWHERGYARLGCPAPEWPHCFHISARDAQRARGKVAFEVATAVHVAEARRAKKEAAALEEARRQQKQNQQEQQRQPQQQRAANSSAVIPPLGGNFVTSRQQQQQKQVQPQLQQQQQQAQQQPLLLPGMLGNASVRNTAAEAPRAARPVPAPGVVANVDMDTTAWDEVQQLDSMAGWEPAAGSEDAFDEDEVIVFRPSFGTNAETGPALNALPPAALVGPMFGLGASVGSNTGGITSTNPFAFAPQQRQQQNNTTA